MHFLIALVTVKDFPPIPHNSLWVKGKAGIQHSLGMCNSSGEMLIAYYLVNVKFLTTDLDHYM